MVLGKGSMAAIGIAFLPIQVPKRVERASMPNPTPTLMHYIHSLGWIAMPPSSKLRSSSEGQSFNLPSSNSWASDYCATAIRSRRFSASSARQTTTSTGSFRCAGIWERLERPLEKGFMGFLRSSELPRSTRPTSGRMGLAIGRPPSLESPKRSRFEANPGLAI